MIRIVDDEFLLEGMRKREAEAALLPDRTDRHPMDQRLIDMGFRQTDLVEAAQPHAADGKKITRDHLFNYFHGKRHGSFPSKEFIAALELGLADLEARKSLAC